MATYVKEQDGTFTDLSKGGADRIIAPVENTTTASRNYVAGTYAKVVGYLRKVTSAITSGSTFTDNNSTQTTVGEELTSLQTQVTNLNTALSDIADYSTTETKIGKWIDNSDIYRLVVHLNTTVATTGGAWTTVATVSGLSVSKLLKCTLSWTTQIDNPYTIIDGQQIKVFTYVNTSVDDIIIEYIK